MVETKLKGAKIFTRTQALRMRKHREAIQRGMAIALSNTRRRAGERIIENTTGTLNPYRARKKQPSTDGRLTSRTGKLKYMLEYGLSSSDPLKSWGDIKGDKVLKEKDNISLKGQIKTIASLAGADTKSATRAYESYRGTYRTNIQANGRLFSTYGGMPQETVRTLAIRFNWETGIRGQRRPIFAPVVKLSEFDMTNEIKKKNATIWS